MARWRLQLLGELGVGWRLRAQGDVEKLAVSNLKRSLGAPNGNR
jgi:hypothetical protein